MSKDIRTYFLKANGSSGGKTKPEEYSPQPKKRTRRVIESDDESDNDFQTSKKKPREVETKSKLRTPQKKPEVIVQVEDFFGNTPVLQKKRTLIPSEKKDESKEGHSDKNKKKGKKKVKNSTNIESRDLTFENDDELEASLLQTDDEQLVLGILSLGKKDKHKSDDGTKVEQKKEKPSGSSSVESEKKITPPRKEAKSTPKKEDNKTSIIDSEKKKRNAEAYQKFLHRSGPKNPGSKEIPKGNPTCLQGLTFVITGVLDSLEREEAVEVIQRCGGRVVSQVSKKTDFVIVGEEPGASKIQKAENFGTKKISEDELLDLIRKKSDVDEEEKDVIKGTPEKTSKYFDSHNSRKRSKKAEETTPTKAKIPKKEEGKKERKKDEFELRHNRISPKKSKWERKDTTKDKPESQSLKVSPRKTKEPTLSSSSPGTEKVIETPGADMLWVDKYKPKSTKTIIGQAGEKSNVKKLTKWLQNWHKNHSNKGSKKVAKPAPWVQNDDGSYYKAALLSGPPGVGKTTSVHLVCEELGLDIIEFNASDTRSKRLLQEEVSELLSTKSIRGFLEGSGDSYRKHVLVMDEVDGMAGNEDRGGVQELIQLIKNTKVPIVGICNDRNHQKMRSLVNYCFDLRFQRPRVEQIKAAMKSVCFKENISISGEALEALIISSNHDVRQVLHNLSVLATGGKNLSVEEAKKKGEQAKKPLNLGPWDVVRKVFSSSEQEKMSLMDKSDLFFQDYSLGPLFVQDTYLRVKPYKAKNNKMKLELISRAADSLILGDIVEKTIRSRNAWNLLPVQAIFSSVLPGHYMSGHVQGQIQFPVWLGENSKRNKFDRLLQELHSSLRMSVTGTKESVNMDYLTRLKDSIVKPLIEEGSEGVQEALKFMLEYNLTREDLDHILQLSSWSNVKDSFSEVDSKVKAALTRALNKESQPVSRVSKRPAKTLGGDNELDMENTAEEVEEDEENDNIDLDPMIKKGKPKKTKKEESTSKGKSTKETTKKGREKKKK